jgi:hypothetical protein
MTRALPLRDSYLFGFEFRGRIYRSSVPYQL